MPGDFLRAWRPPPAVSVDVLDSVVRDVPNQKMTPAKIVAVLVRKGGVICGKIGMGTVGWVAENGQELGAEELGFYFPQCSAYVLRGA